MAETTRAQIVRVGIDLTKNVVGVRAVHGAGCKLVSKPIKPDRSVAFLPIKAPEQQGVTTLHRVHGGRQEDRADCCGQQERPHPVGDDDPRNQLQGRPRQRQSAGQARQAAGCGCRRAVPGMRQTLTDRTISVNHECKKTH